jgi:serine/threonine protein kinase
MTGEVLSRLGPYEVREIIRRGGMSTVFKAYQPSLDRYVALKVLPYTDDRTAVARFEQEARAIAQLAHPNIVPIYDFGEFDGQLYIAVQHVEGGHSLADVLGRPMEPAHALRLMIGVLAALGCAHQRGIVHRDVKPGNILLPFPEWAMLTDFGVARVVGMGSGRLTQQGLIIGTPAYMAPEQAFGLEVDGRTDLYAAGVVLYEMLTGSVPFDAENPVAALQMHAYEPPAPPRSRNPDLDEDVDNVLLRALAKRADERYQTAVEMRADLEALLAGARPAARDWVDAGRPELLFEEGVRAFREGRWADAIGRLSQVAAADPADEDVEAMLEVARVEYARAQLDHEPAPQRDPWGTVNIPFPFLPRVGPEHLPADPDRPWATAPIDLSALVRAPVDDDRSPPPR